MRIFTRFLTVVALASLLCPHGLGAQEKPKSDNFRWFIGAQLGVFTFETPAQTRGTIMSAGAHTIIKARRTGLLLSVDEGITSACLKNGAAGTCDQYSSYLDATAPGGVRQVIFHDTRQYSAVLMAWPIYGNLQPYFGVGVALVHTIKEYPQGTFATPDELAAAQDEANSRGSYGAGTALAGIQARVKGFALFAQAQIMTSPGNDKLLAGGPPFGFSAGLRVSLGSSREGVSGGGY
jgi:hypothetical protein